jgi:hypothetical protein
MEVLPRPTAASHAARAPGVVVVHKLHADDRFVCLFARYQHMNNPSDLNNLFT